MKKQAEGYSYSAGRDARQAAEKAFKDRKAETKDIAQKKTGKVQAAKFQ